MKMLRAARQVAFAVFALGTPAALAGPYTPYSFLTAIPVPTGPGNTVAGQFKTYDIAFFDANTQNYYLADRSNASVDVFSAKTDQFVTRINGFVGQVADNGHSGPDGVLVVNSGNLHQLWASDGNSTISGFALGGSNAAPTFTQLLGTPISTAIGGASASGRVDEMAYSPLTNTILAANNAATPTPFSSIINVSGTPTLGSKTVFDGTGTTPNAAAGIEQPTWNATTNSFWVSIVQIGTSASDSGGISEVNPTTGAVLRTISFASLGIASCGPTGLVTGPAGRMLVVCGNGATQTLVIDPTKTGAAQLVTSISQTSGGDEAWYSPTTNLYFLADRNNVPNGSAPVLGIIDALTNTFFRTCRPRLAITRWRLTPYRVRPSLLPVQPLRTPGGAACVNGCILVYSQPATAVPEPGSRSIIATALLGLFGLVRSRRA